MNTPNNWICAVPLVFRFFAENEQETQLLQRGRAMLRVIEYVA